MVCAELNTIVGLNRERDRIHAMDGSDVWICLLLAVFGICCMEVVWLWIISPIYISGVTWETEPHLGECGEVLCSCG